MHPPKRKCSALTQFVNLQPLTKSLNTLTDHLTQLEEDVATDLTAVANELKSEVDLLESRLTDLQNKAGKQPHTEISALSDDFFAPTPLVV